LLRQKKMSVLTYKDIFNLIIAVTIMSLTICWNEISLKRLLWTVFTMLLTVVGLAAAFWPRLQIEATEQVDSLSPLPLSVTLTNGIMPLDQVSVFVRICQARNDTGGRIVGRASSSCDGPSRRGGITTPAWQNHYLQVDDKWVIPMGRNVPFSFNVTEADISVVVRYWLPFIPRLDFDLFEKEARFRIFKKVDGERVWIRIPVD
jgi:hypothetical protein